MRKTIFVLALFTVILSYSLSNSKPFLKETELEEYEDEELATTKGKTTKTTKSKSKPKGKTTKTTKSKSKTKPNKDSTTGKATKATKTTPATNKKQQAPTTVTIKEFNDSNYKSNLIIALVSVAIGSLIWCVAMWTDEAKKEKKEKSSSDI